MIKGIKKTIKNKKGFTMIEFIVGMSVFIIAATIISGLFIRSIKAQRQSNHLTVLNSDTGLVMEKIIREAREGHSFTSPASSGSCSEDLIFIRNIEGKDTAINYGLQNGNIVLSQDTNIESPSFNSFMPLNSSQVKIQELCFIKTQETSGDPWRITIIIKAGSIDPDIAYTSNIQTTVAARFLPQDINNE
ncbi:MAG: type II secretion system protein [Candidatus Paceibacterota bacterium]